MSTPEARRLLRQRNPMLAKYREHRDNIRARDIAFELTFEQWSMLWKESGKWEQRGSRSGQFYMCRRNDTGSFTLDNVIIYRMEKDKGAGARAIHRYRERHSQSMIYKYRAHRQNAKARGIVFRLTFEQWAAIWKASGKWKRRGSLRGTYCMARYGDQGAYEVGNVAIIRNEENRSERNSNYPMRGQDNPAYGKDYWATASSEERAQRSARISAMQRGISKSKRMRSRLAESTTGRKRVIRDGRVTWAYPGDLDFPGTF
jgi:hypothetical protein